MSVKRNCSPASSERGVGMRLLLVWLTTLSAYAVLLAVRLANAPSIPWFQLVPFGVFSVCLCVLWLVLRHRDGQVDTGIVLVASFLTGLGIAMQFRMGTFAEGQGTGFALALPLGFAAMAVVFLAASDGRWKFLTSVTYACYGAAVIVLAAMIVLGRRYRGGIYLPGNLNPTEIVKPLLVVFLAGFLSGRRREFSETQIGIPVPPAKALWLLAFLWAVPLGLVLLLHDLGLLLLLNAVLVVMLYAVGRKSGYLILGALGVAASGALLCMVSAHAKTRFDIWLHPFADPTGGGWQILQGLSAMNAGGIWGAGIGAGAPQSVPIVTSDFVYAAVAEELGILVCALVLMAYGCLFVRGWRTASRVKSPFGSLLAIGLTATLCFQTLLNLGGVTKALPLTGIALPFLSQGGSSLATTFAMIGLLSALSADRGEREKK